MIDADLAPDDFAGDDNRKVAAFLFEYYRNPKYKGAMPSPEILRRKFPGYELPKPPSKGIEYIIDQIRERAVYNLLSESVIGVSRALKKNDLAAAQEALHRASQKIASRAAQTKVFALTRTTELRKQRYLEKRSGGMIGIPTGFDWIDRVTMGWQREDFILALSKRGVGKTWLALICAIAAQKAGHSPLFISREMGNRQIMDRYDALHARLPYEAFRRGELGHALEKQYFQALEEQKNLSEFYLPEFEGKCTPLAILAKALENNCTFVVIDGIYMLDADPGDPQTGWEKFVAVAKSIKANLCKAHGLTVFATNQFNREKDVSEADLDQSAYSDAFAQYADIALKLYQGPDERESGEMLMGFLKLREGPLPLRARRMKWDFDKMQFGDIEGYDDDATSEGAASAEVRY